MEAILPLNLCMAIACKLAKVRSITASSTRYARCDEGIPPRDRPQTPILPVSLISVRKQSNTESTSFFRLLGDGVPVDNPQPRQFQTNTLRPFSRKYFKWKLCELCTICSQYIAFEPHKIIVERSFQSRPSSGWPDWNSMQSSLTFGATSIHIYLALNYEASKRPIYSVSPKSIWPKYTPVLSQPPKHRRKHLGTLNLLGAVSNIQQNYSISAAHFLICAFESTSAQIGKQQSVFGSLNSVSY